MRGGAIAFNALARRTWPATWRSSRSINSFYYKSYEPTTSLSFHSSSFVTQRDSVNYQKYQGRIHRYRKQLVAAHTDNSDVTESDVATNTSSLIQETFSVLASRGRTWRRLRHLVDLACTDDRGPGVVQSVVDVGCDHGLLAIGLAVSGRFERVVGIDVSQRALQDGALSFLKELRSLLKENDNAAFQKELVVPVEFRVGDGLRSLRPGEADVVCIAGIGVHTMLKILLQKEPRKDSRGPREPLLTDVLESEVLLLQPTNSKPRNLVLLYDQLQLLGWRVDGERIEKLSSRWYISTSFVRGGGAEVSEQPKDVSRFTLPGQRLIDLEDLDPMKEAYQDYVQHHTSWLSRDMNRNGNLDDQDKRWLEANGIDAL